MRCQQVTIRLKPRARGCHLITSEIMKALPLDAFTCGTVHLLLQHTSASLTLNENCDRSVQLDMTDAFNRLVPEVCNAISPFLLTL